MATSAQPIGVIARLLDLSERRVQQLSREGVIPKAERGQHDLVCAVRGYVVYLRDLVVRVQAGAPDFGIERARLTKATRIVAALSCRPSRASPIRTSRGTWSTSPRAARRSSSGPSRGA